MAVWRFKIVTWQNVTTMFQVYSCKQIGTRDKCQKTLLRLKVFTGWQEISAQEFQKIWIFPASPANAVNQCTVVLSQLFVLKYDHKEEPSFFIGRFAFQTHPNAWGAANYCGWKRGSQGLQSERKYRNRKTTDDRSHRFFTDHAFKNVKILLIRYKKMVLLCRRSWQSIKITTAMSIVLLWLLRYTTSAHFSNPAYYNDNFA